MYTFTQIWLVELAYFRYTKIIEGIQYQRILIIIGPRLGVAQLCNNYRNAHLAAIKAKDLISGTVTTSGFQC